MLTKIPMNHENNDFSSQNLNEFGKTDFRHVKETRYFEITMDIKGIPWTSRKNGGALKCKTIVWEELASPIVHARLLLYTMLVVQ
jgi:hypothetical protein